MSKQTPKMPADPSPKQGFWDSLKSAFTFERAICRLVAAWCLYAMISLLTTEGDFYKLAFAQDNSTGAMIAIIALFYVLLTAVSALLPRFETDSWGLMLGATVCVVRWLAKYSNEISYKVVFGSSGSESYMYMNSDGTLFLLAVIAVYLLFVFYFLQRNQDLFDSLNVPTWTVWVAVGVFGAVSCVISAGTAALRYMTFVSPNFDLGIFVQMLYNMVKTGLPNTTCERDVLLSHFAVHLTPMCYSILPIYAIFPSGVTLQIVQSVVLVSGIIPAILLARHLKLSWRSQVLVALIYAFYPVTTMGCFYDFHENFFMLPLLLWLFYFFEREKIVPMYIFAALTLLVKEDAAIYVIFFAIYAVLTRRSKKTMLHGGLIGLISIAYFAFALAYLNSAGEYWTNYYKEIGETANPAIAGAMTYRYGNLIYNSDQGLAGAILTALKNPGYLLTDIFSTDGQRMDSFFSEQSPWAKAVYILQMLLPVGLIPFFTKKQSRWLLVAPLLLNILTTYKYQYSLNFQYHFGITAFLMYAMILNLPDLKPVTRRHLVTVGAVAACCMYIFLVIPKFNGYVDSWNKNQEKYQRIEAMLEEIPEDASVAATGSYVPHLANRTEVYELQYHASNAAYIKDDDVDYVVIRTGSDNKYRKNYEGKGYVVWKEYEGHVILHKPQA